MQKNRHNSAEGHIKTILNVNKYMCTKIASAKKQKTFSIYDVDAFLHCLYKAFTMYKLQYILFSQFLEGCNVRPFMAYLAEFSPGTQLVTYPRTG